MKQNDNNAKLEEIQETLDIYTKAVANITRDLLELDDEKNTLITVKYQSIYILLARVKETLREFKENLYWFLTHIIKKMLW